MEVKDIQCMCKQEKHAGLKHVCLRHACKDSPCKRPFRSLGSKENAKIKADSVKLSLFINSNEICNSHYYIKRRNVGSVVDIWTHNYVPGEVNGFMSYLHSRLDNLKVIYRSALLPSCLIKDGSLDFLIKTRANHLIE